MLTEPLWGIPFNLYGPFASVYMLALGVGEQTIGTIAAFGLALQVVCSLLGGPVTDKLGRKRATLIFDTISWSIPALLWAFARNAGWFYLAAFFNAIVRIPMTSWTCLFIEDAPPDRVVHYWAWVHIAGIVAGLVTPIAGLLIDRFELIPTMRAIYLFAFVSMTAKFVILNRMSIETVVGRTRMIETAGIPFSRLVRQSLSVFRSVFSRRGTVAVVVLLSMNSIYVTIRNAFLGVLLTGSLGFPPDEIGWFAALRSVVMLLFYFFVLPKLKTDRYLRYLITGLATAIAALAVLVLAPTGSHLIAALAIFVESCGMALVVPHLEGFVFAAVDRADRARILAVANTVVLAVASPFGWIAGALAEIDHVLPFVLVMTVAGLALLFLILARPDHRGDRGRADPRGC